jgi:SAM-dependent methyltransferase
VISEQFSHPLLVAAHDTLNPLGADRDYWLALVERLAPLAIIDVGCGTGLLTCELPAPGRVVVGIDPSPAMLTVARGKPGARGVRWIEGGVERLAGRQADLILMTSHVAQLFLDDDAWRAALETARHALRPGGRLAFDCRARLSPPFPGWPTAQEPRSVLDPGLGAIEWHHEILSAESARVRYLHFRFTELDRRVTSTDELAFRTREEVTRSLDAAGFDVESLAGDWDGSPVTPSSLEWIVVARRR